MSKIRNTGISSSISSLTGECAAQKIKNICSSSLWTCLHHMVILRSQNKITDFLMILAWASPFKCILKILCNRLIWSFHPLISLSVCIHLCIFLRYRHFAIQGICGELNNNLYYSSINLSKNQSYIYIYIYIYI